MKLYTATLVSTYLQAASTVVKLMIAESASLIQYDYYFRRKDELTCIELKVYCNNQMLDIVEINYQTLENIVAANSETVLKPLSKPYQEKEIMRIFGSYSLLFKSIVHYIPQVMLFCLKK